MAAGWASRSCIGSRCPAGTTNLSFLHSIETCSGAQPASSPVDTEGYVKEVKGLGREGDLSPPSYA
jgi:hypothetical protein